MKEIKLENFRCYVEQNIILKRGINLLIGDNASGKTSILKACRYVLSAFFSGFSDENTKWISPAVDDFRIRITNGVILPELPINIGFTCDPEMYDTIQLKNKTLNPSNQSYNLSKNTKKNSRSLTSGIKGYRDYCKLLHKLFMSEESGQVYALPLFVSFTTEDIHTSRKIDSKRFQSYAQKSSFGYYECLSGEGFFPYWIKRLLILNEAGKNTQEIDIVRNAIKSALGPEGCNIIDDMQIRSNQKKVYYILTDSREIESSHLSDGYRRLVNIVTDIAFRCALLNRVIFGLESTTKTRGTVLIDEIDLHLHPSLQSLVLKGLRNAFPNLQFIITTHAPLIMSGVESNNENIVYKLAFSPDNGYSMREISTYGMDVSTITETIMEQIPRDHDVDAELSALYDLIDNNENDRARTLLHELQSKFGDSLPDLAQAETMLNFTFEDDEENL